MVVYNFKVSGKALVWEESYCFKLFYREEACENKIRSFCWAPKYCTGVRSMRDFKTPVSLINFE